METPPPQFTPYPRPGLTPEPGRVRLDVISEAFNVFGKHATTFIVGAIPIAILCFVGFIFGLVSNFYDPDAFSVEAAFGLLGGMFGGACISIVVMYMLLAGLTNLAVKAVKGEPITASDALSMNGKWASVLAAVLIMVLVVTLASFLCCLPGLLLHGLFLLTFPLIIQNGLGPIEAMQVSYDTLKKDIWPAMLVGLVGHILLSVTQQFMGIGVVVGAPVFALMIAIVYRDFFITPQQATATPGGWPTAPTAPAPAPQTFDEWDRAREELDENSLPDITPDEPVPQESEVPGPVEPDGDPTLGTQPADEEREQP